MTNKYKDISTEYFNKIARNYASTYDGKHAKDLYRTVLQKLNTIPFSSILDIGCGTGEILSLVSTAKSVSMSGIDISPQMTHIAKEMLGERADIRHGDSEELPWPDNSFDVVISIDVFHHCPHPQKVLMEMYRVLKQDGFLIMADPWAPSPLRQLINGLIFPTLYRRKGDIRIYSESEICRLLEECQFKSIEWEIVGKTSQLLSLRIYAHIVTARPTK